MAGSSWDKIVDKIDVEKLSQDNLVESCLENAKIRNVIDGYLQEHVILKKSNNKNTKVAIAKRIEGNENFEKKNYENSLTLYSESIKHAENDSECLPLSYSNRSLVLQKMGYFMESLQDIDLALSTGYPKNQIKKLLLRKAKCLIELGQHDKANNVIKENFNKSEAKKLFATLNSENVGSKESLDNVGSDNVDILPQLTGGSNATFVAASSLINIFYNESLGRHVLATNNIKIGDVLFVEKPYAFIFFSDVCHNCGKETVAPIPCDKCLDVIYCSLECKENFWKLVHCFECGYGELFKSIGIAHLSLRIILATSLNFLELKRNIDGIKKPELQTGIITYNDDDYSRVYNLVSNFGKYDAKDLFQYASTAVLLTLFLKNCTPFFDNASEKNNLKVVAFVLLKHILQLICNGYGITKIVSINSKSEEVNDVKEERIGTAIYPSASMMNHSCEPSVMHSFYKNIIIVRASKPIKKGEQVFNCYGQDARVTKRNIRQKALKQQYFFDCKCQACTQPFDIQDMLTALKCLKCKGPLVLNEEANNYFCLSCKNFFTKSDELLEKERLFYLLLNEGENLAIESVNVGLVKLIKSWQLGREIFFKFHKDLCYSAYQVALCLVKLEDYKKSILFLKCVVLSLEKRFGSHSIELANELKKIGDVITAYCTKSPNDTREMAKEGLQYYHKSLKIMNLLIGCHNEDVKKMKIRYDLLLFIAKNSQ